MFEKTKGFAEKKLIRAHIFSNAAQETANFTSNASQRAKEMVIGAATKGNEKKTNKLAGTLISRSTNMANAKSAAQYASGVRGYKDIKAARQIKMLAERKISAAVEATENRKKVLNEELGSYAEIKINVIKSTICVFVEYLRKMGRGNKWREIEALKSEDIKKEDIAEIEDLSISSANLAKGVTGSTAIGTIALLGTKALVSKGVIAFASASKGAAISSMGSVAATNATLAFLSGGAISALAGGVAAGTVVMGGIAAGAFAAVATLTGGILLSNHGSKALTRAKRYSAEVDKAISTFEKSWVVMDEIRERVKEYKELTLKLEQKAIIELEKLEPLVPIFEPGNAQHRKVFKKVASLIQSIREMANTPVLDEDGNIANGCGITAGKMRSLLKA